MAEEASLQLFRRYYEPANRHNRGMASEWAAYESAYLGEPPFAKPSGLDSWKSYIYFKYGWQQIQTLAAELATEDDANWVFEPRNAMQVEYARIVQAVSDYQLQMDDYPTKRLMAALIASVYGGCPLKVIWDYKCVKRRIRLSDGTVKLQKVVVKDQPTIVLVDPRDFLYDHRARTSGEWRYVFHRMRMTIDELKDRTRSDGTPMYKNLDQLDGERGKGTGPSDQELGEPMNDFAGERKVAKSEGIQVVEMWTADRLIVVANGQTVIRDEPNPFFHGRIPFEVATIIPTLNDSWGQSAIWALRDVQELIWTIDNAGTDALKLMLDPPLAVDVSADHENMERAFFPGARFPSKMGAAQAIQPMRVADVQPFVSDQAVGSLLDRMKHVTGITDELAGVGNSDTATEAALNQRQAKGRVSIMLRNVDRAFAKCSEMFLALDQQYLNLTKPIKLMGPNGAYWKHIAPHEIAGMWEVRPKNSSERAVLELKKQNDLEALSNLLPANGLVTADGMTLNLTPLFHEIADDYKLNREQVVVPMQMMLQAQAAQTIAQGQAEVQVQAMMAQVMPPEQQATEQPPNLLQDAQAKLFQSINYKDMPDAAQRAMLETIGLPSDGVEDDNRNPTRPNAGANPISEGLKAYNKSGGREAKSA